MDNYENGYESGLREGYEKGVRAGYNELYIVMNTTLNDMTEHMLGNKTSIGMQNALNMFIAKMHEMHPDNVFTN